MTAKQSPSDVDDAARDDAPGVTHKIDQPKGGLKQEDVEDRPSVSMTIPDKYPDDQ